MKPAIIAQFTHGNSPAKIKDKSYIMVEDETGQLVPRDPSYRSDAPRNVAKSLATILSRKPDTTPTPKGGPLS